MFIIISISIKNSNIIKIAIIPVGNIFYIKNIKTKTDSFSLSQNFVFFKLFKKTNNWYSKEVNTIHKRNIRFWIVWTSYCYFLFSVFIYCKDTTTTNVKCFIIKEKTFICWRTACTLKNNFC